MKTQQLIEIRVLDEANEFIENLTDKARKKVLNVLARVSSGERDAQIFKKLDDYDIWEFRVLFNKQAIRLFAFWDEDARALIVCTHGIIKKTQKTPMREIAKANTIKKEYFTRKNRT